MRSLFKTERAWVHVNAFDSQRTVLAVAIFYEEDHDLNTHRICPRQSERGPGCGGRLGHGQPVSDDSGTTFGRAACLLLSRQSCTEWVEKQLAPGRAERGERLGAQLLPGGSKNQKALGAPRLDSGAALCPGHAPPRNHCTKNPESGTASTAVPLPPRRGEGGAGEGFGGNDLPQVQAVKGCIAWREFLKSYK